MSTTVKTGDLIELVEAAERVNQDYKHTMNYVTSDGAKKAGTALYLRLESAIERIKDSD